MRNLDFLEVARQEDNTAENSILGPICGYVGEPIRILIGIIKSKPQEKGCRLLCPHHIRGRIVIIVTGPLLVFMKATIDFCKDLHGKCMYSYGDQLNEGQFRCLRSDWYRLVSIEDLHRVSVIISSGVSIPRCRTYI